MMDEVSEPEPSSSSEVVEAEEEEVVLVSERSRKGERVPEKKRGGG